MELVGPKRRTLVGVLFQIAYSIGLMMISFVAYFVRDDYYLQVATMLPAFLFVPLVL